MTNFIFSPLPHTYTHFLVHSAAADWLVHTFPTFVNTSQSVPTISFFKPCELKNTVEPHPIYKTAPPYYEPYFFHPNVKITYKGVVI